MTTTKQRELLEQLCDKTKLEKIDWKRHDSSTFKCNIATITMEMGWYETYNLCNDIYRNYYFTISNENGLQAEFKHSKGCNDYASFHNLYGAVMDSADRQMRDFINSI